MTIHLVWLGIQALSIKSLFSVETTQRRPRTTVFYIGFLSTALNPKPGLFVLAFVVQLVNPLLDPVSTQMVIYAAWFALLTATGFSLMGILSSQLSTWFKNRPALVAGLNIGAGITFISSGVVVAFMHQP
ncbi:hypothetical protein GCM10008090_21060 [Arenicella chitinivorans]|uniref:Uncharacterized protein n=1 Tax=Arenicella chitinivorans TaxID=1329800 RepID=A0A918RU67_9GAMM|nr:LysE family transporter [Arenicella chitinivorans]GHA11088.1 hypothetical protein GCM10008090_21060 [Arenicella chitinivorans]